MVKPFTKSRCSAAFALGTDRELGLLCCKERFLTNSFAILVVQLEA